VRRVRPLAGGTSERGFTLLEVLIATAVMAVGIVSALQLFTGSMNLAGNAGKQSQAAVLAQALIDEELWRDVLENNERSGTEGVFTWTVVTHPIERELRSPDEVDDGIDPVSGELGLWLIEAEVSWESPTGTKSLVYETARIGELVD
jgi:prepilin-type N-terminal cleavage/methylation domain-containing protein